MPYKAPTPKTSSYATAISKPKAPTRSSGATSGVGISSGALGNIPLPPTQPRAQTTQYDTGGYDTGGYDSGGGGGYGGGGGGGGYGYGVGDPNVDYLQEAGYLASISALDEALANFNAQDKAERGRYDLDFKKGLGDLGYKDENIDDEVAGKWDWNDLLTASGRGYQTNTNDFASRGMLQSQGYLDSLKMLERSLEDQRGAMGTARQNFRSEKDAALTNYKTQDTASRNTSKADAISRLAASLGMM